jgi:hypothetical protein
MAARLRIKNTPPESGYGEKNNTRYLTINLPYYDFSSIHLIMTSSENPRFPIWQ